MKTRVRGWLARSVFTAEGLARLHGRRQSVNPTEGNRTRANLGLGIFLVAVMFLALFSLMWVQRDDAAYLESLNGVAILDNDALAWTIRASKPVDCADKDFDACRKGVRIDKVVFEGRDLTAIDLPALLQSPDPKATTFLHFHTTVPHALWEAAASEGAMVVSLPPLRFDALRAAVNGQPAGIFYGSDRPFVRFVHDAKAPKDASVEMVMAALGSQKLLLGGEKDATQVFVAQQWRFQKYNDMLAARRSGHGKQLADIARVVLAVFSLLLFLLVDSSPESLGLALFMSCKAIAVIFGNNWLPEDLLPDAGMAWFKAWLLCFGDVLQFYFFTQLARVARPKLTPWFVIGGAVAALYATLQYLNLSVGDVSVTTEVWRWRNVGLGLCCMVTALTSAVYLFKMKLYYRSTALLIAFSGTIVQVVYPLVAYWPEVAGTAWFRTFYNVFETHTPYVFALSTFINLTTLETRVKALSKELVQAKEIEREMALGKVVQQSFLRVPAVPEQLAVACVHEAALYVSGDIYYVWWDAEREILTLIINDVTGHGVQAALKASICTTIADSIWAEDQIRETDATSSRFQSYDRRLHAFLSRMANAPEIVSLVGGEFDLRHGTISLYRVGGVFPLLVERIDGRWKTRLLALRNRTLQSEALPRGGFVVMLSDGYVDTSRAMHDFHRHLNERLAGRGPELSAEEVKAEALAFTKFATTNDDRTMLVFQYKDPERSAGRTAA